MRLYDPDSFVPALIVTLAIVGAAIVTIVELLL